LIEPTGAWMNRRDFLAALPAVPALANAAESSAARPPRARRPTRRFYDEPHRFTVAMQDEAFAWLDRHLKG
jgi:hypothetical protein